MHKYHHSPEQHSLLLEEVREVMHQLMAINFDKPEEDEQNIRHHAYLKGKLAMSQKILEDEFQPPDHTNESTT